jgi:hypothetical protein
MPTKYEHAYPELRGRRYLVRSWHGELRDISYRVDTKHGYHYRPLSPNTPTYRQVEQRWREAKQENA